MAPTVVVVSNICLSKENAQKQYRNTPIYEPRYIRNGKQAHVGNGVFLSRCRFCQKTFLSYGPVPTYLGIGRHEYTRHDAEVTGINKPVLPA